MTIQDQAREVFAKELEAKGTAWANTANSVRAGYSNVWIAAAIDALQELLRLVPDEADTDEGGRP